MRRNTNRLTQLVLLAAVLLFCLQFAAAQSLEKYVGQYQFPGNEIVIVTLENGKLMLEVVGWRKFELLGESENVFTAQDENLKISFVKDAQGQIIGMIFLFRGSEERGEKISSQIDKPVKPIDKSPHESGFVKANGIKMHYLDWGGKGETIVMLHGNGRDAHSFDEFAPKFTARFRVIALTWRGHGESDKPGYGYDTATLVEDLRQFLDVLKLKRVHLIGHSLSGYVITPFAGLYPNRVGKLVYLDSGYDYSNLKALGEKDPLRPTPPPPPHEIYEAFSNSLVGVRPDYAKVKAPALSFYALYSETNPSITPKMDKATRKKAQEYWGQTWVPYQREQIKRFRREVKRGRVIVLRDTHHFFFQDPKQQDAVVREIHAFLGVE